MDWLQLFSILFVCILSVHANAEITFVVPNVARFMETSNPHPTFAEPIKNVTVIKGREAKLTCVVDDLGSYKVAWVRVDTQTILTIHRHIITRNYRIYLSHGDHRSWYLHIRDIEELDRGWYMCQINTDPMVSHMGYLEVVVPPDIIDRNSSRDLVVSEGQNATLSCSASGYPEPDITWKREDGQMIFPNGTDGRSATPSMTGKTLDLSSVTRHHMGVYLCIANNDIPPAVSKRLHLKVQFPPRIDIAHQLVAGYIGQDITLSCNVESFPTPIHYWAKGDNQTMIVPGDKYSSVSKESGYKVIMRLKIHRVTQEDYTSYSCVAKNMLGETTGTIKMYEVTRPSHLQSRKLERQENRMQRNQALSETEDNNTSFLSYPHDMLVLGAMNGGARVPFSGTSLVLVIVYAITLWDS